IIFIVSLRLGIRSYDILVDKAPEGIEKQVSEICESIPGVYDCSRVRARASGSHVFVDVVVSVDPATSVDDAHVVADLVEREISKIASNVDCIVHIEPKSDIASPEGRHVVYGILAALARSHPEIDSVHNVRILKMPEGIHLGADLEMSPSMALSEAHRISEEFEKAVQVLIPEIASTSLHLEASEFTSAATDVTTDNEDLIAKIREYVNALDNCQCRDIHVAEDDSGLIVSLTCGIDGSLSLTESHEFADMIERSIRRNIIETKIFVHMEPE
ncbi:MAG: cation transporter dimerization domain-containing protein, partial [Candidatus Thorarchaeota archaeon]|nr:cation transporter dimerization domain-containing protein [Candidatus Thorarchaeota archaeon]